MECIVTHLFHMLPMNPGAVFCSAKLALRAAADASMELRFWFIRPENFPEPADDCCDVEISFGVRHIHTEAGVEKVSDGQWMRGCGEGCAAEKGSG